jgi:heme A synthase
MTQEHSQHHGHDTASAAYQAGDALTPRESAEAANLWFPNRPPDLVPELSSVSDLARALGVEEARARELVRDLRARLVQSEVEAVAAAVYRNRRRTPGFVWVILVLLVLLLGAAMYGTLTVTHSVAPPSAVVTEPAPAIAPATPPAPPSSPPGP